MPSNDHSELKGTHAFLSASKNSWLNYSDEVLVERFFNSKAAEIGELLHALAAEMITKRIQLNKTDRHLISYYLASNGIPRYLIRPEKWIVTMSNYVNDALYYDMKPEEVLYYSPFCYGTTDAVSFKDNLLRIHDLKTGTSQVHMEQLEIYEALFCFENKIDPKDIKAELRIYQSEEIIYYEPPIEEIEKVMDRIAHCDAVLQKKVRKYLG